jgi:hypothetical protein
MVRLAMWSRRRPDEYRQPCGTCTGQPTLQRTTVIPGPCPRWARGVAAPRSAEQCRALIRLSPGSPLPPTARQCRAALMLHCARRRSPVVLSPARRARGGARRNPLTSQPPCPLVPRRYSAAGLPAMTRKQRRLARLHGSARGLNTTRREPRAALPGRCDTAPAPIRAGRTTRIISSSESNSDIFLDFVSFELTISDTSSPWFFAANAAKIMQLAMRSAILVAPQ